MKQFRKWIIRGMPIIVVIMVIGLALSRIYSPESSTREAKIQISAFEAVEYIGKFAEVCGVVESADFLPEIGGEPTFLNLGRPHPDQPFTVVIWGSDRNRFRIPPEDRYITRTICVTGQIRDHQGTPQIVVRNPDQISDG